MTLAVIEYRDCETMTSLENAKARHLHYQSEIARLTAEQLLLEIQKETNNGKPENT